MSTKFEELEAKYMFEKLGWLDVSENYQSLIRYEKHDFILGTHIITIVEFEKGAILDGKNEVYITTRYNETVGCSHITVEELQAINKQIEELGWNNE